MPEVKKAKIEVLDTAGNKISNDIEVLFNPAQYSLSDSVSYTTWSLPFSDVPMTYYCGGKAATLSMELFLYTGPMLNASGNNNVVATDVTKKVKEFEELIYINDSMRTPPIVRFVWGALSFKGVVTELNTTFTKFTESGMPIQAKLSISLMTYYDLRDQERGSSLEATEYIKYCTIRDDYSIFDIAQSEYGNISKWKVIAKANGIYNPLGVRSGTVVMVPVL